jgi:Tfp pilus assembly major pilin PilA
MNVMRETMTNAGVALAVAGCAVVAGVIGWNIGRPRHHSSTPPAASALHRAATTMESITSYHFAGQVTIGTESLSLSGEFSAPDHLHETLSLPGVAPVERILIGTSTYQRSGTKWQLVAAASTSSDPRTTFGSLAAVTNVTANGTVYSFSVTGPATASLISGTGTTTTITGTAAVQGGKITNVSYRSATGAGTAVTFSYTALNTSPPVTAPAA